MVVVLFLVFFWVFCGFCFGFWFLLGWKSVGAQYVFVLGVRIVEEVAAWFWWSEMTCFCAFLFVTIDSILAILGGGGSDT